ncbi:MerR family transcriptional regulator [Corynebacterium vitaeruminis]|uniref:MerR family transcriptional regulator n=1 Tax=Corynebacterium vitaeruminis DSM 20294 TaxID=1224164 RepID=W5XZW3_9CORY|nr:MerR family transcriptional regulator [Corynebacterium vitaeruminis]AHI22239.1 MerR family transcriptional regulator [Corynebacterium vitaeruminis DSM 20294]
MKIGELARRTGTTTRQLRYYEEQGLLEPSRTVSNYRDYDESTIQTVRQIRVLVESGIPTRVVRSMLPYVHGPDAQMPHHDDPEIAGLLVTERDRLDETIERLVRSRSQVECYLDRVAPELTSPEFRAIHPVPGQAYLDLHSGD